MPRPDRHADDPRLEVVQSARADAGRATLERSVGGHAGRLVKPIDPADHDDLDDFRTQIAPIAVRRLCAVDPAPDLRELRAFRRVPTRARHLDGQVVAREDEKLHSALVATAGNRERLRTHRELSERIRILRRLDLIGPARTRAADDEHDKTLGPVPARRAGDAGMLIRTHVGASRAGIRRITLRRPSLASQRRPTQASA